MELHGKDYVCMSLDIQLLVSQYDGSMMTTIFKTKKGLVMRFKNCRTVKYCDKYNQRENRK